MRPRKSQVAILVGLISLTVLLSACSGGKKSVITRQQVSAFLEDMDRAAQRKDVETIVAHLSPSVQFKLTIEGFGPTQTLSLNRDQYRDYATQGFAAIEAYDYRRGDTVINVDPDGQTAYVADETFETARMGGNVMQTVTRGTAVLKMEGDVLMIASGESVGRPAQPGSISRRAVLK